MSVLILAQREIQLAQVPAGMMYLPFATAFDAAVALRASDAPAAIVSEGLDIEDIEVLASVVRERDGPCIEVRFARWDGESISPLSAACRGVISGFGANGLGQAISLLEQES